MGRGAGGIGSNIARGGPETSGGELDSGTAHLPTSHPPTHPIQVNDALTRLSRRRLETPYFLLMEAFKMRVTGGVASKTSILRFVNVLIQVSRRPNLNI